MSKQQNTEDNLKEIFYEHNSWLDAIFIPQIAIELDHYGYSVIRYKGKPEYIIAKLNGGKDSKNE